MGSSMALAFLGFVGLALPEGQGPCGPAEARTRVDETITVQMKCASAKDRLEKRGEIYLDAEPDFRDEKNFAVVITKAGAASLKQAGIDDPAAHFADKLIRARGRVKVVDDVPRIEIDEAAQIRLVDPAKPSE